MNREEVESEKDECTLYSVRREDVDAVNVVNWYDMFKDISAKTLLLSIPPEVLKYLKSDGMVMPVNTHTTAHQNLNRSRIGEEGQGRGSDKGAQDDDNDSWASLSDCDDVPCIPSEFLQKISRDQRAERRQELGLRAEEEDFGPVEEDFSVDRGATESSDSEDEERNKSRKLEEVEKFHEFDSLLDSSIKDLGGAVLPKINRKSPKDATWIGFNRSLKCYNPGDIYLLLKTSDVISHLLEDPYRDICDVPESEGASSASGRTSGSTTFTTGTTPYVLVLKQWNDSWGPEMEFRCFICANQLIAICQRDLDTCYSSIAKRKDKLLLNIQNFFLRNVHDRFPIDFYTMDIVYHPNGEIYLVDFDVFGLCTDPLLFTYKELESIYQENLNQTLDISKDDNRLKTPTRRISNRRGPIQPCLRFLTESRNFRGRKTPGQSALANDVMTYIRESVARM